MPTPQLNFDSFEVCGKADNAAVSAVEPATPSPIFLILEVLVEILEVLVSICLWTLTPFIWRSEP